VFESLCVRNSPLGLRFTGKNMTPLPCWLAGAQGVCTSSGSNPGLHGIMCRCVLPAESLIQSLTAGLNFSRNDVSVQLHFALFNGSTGFLLKPPEMCTAPRGVQSEHSDTLNNTAAQSGVLHDRLGRGRDDYWPPLRETLHLTTVELLSLHMCPKVCASPCPPLRCASGEPVC
jgi:hypothetical protein